MLKITAPAPGTMQTEPMLPAIVPAAGQSCRMGAAKQLLPLGETTMIGHVVDELLRSTVDGGVYVVVGHEAEEVVRALSGKPVHIVPNPGYRQGDMLSSIRCGLRALPRGYAAVVVALGDQPAITAGLVDAMVRAFHTKGKGIVVPVHDGKRGHPLLLAERYSAEVLTGLDGTGLRGILAAHPEDVLELPVLTAAVLTDVDSPEDYYRELARLAGEGAEVPGLDPK